MEKIDIKDFAKLVESDYVLNIIDVRPRELYDEGHVPGAMHIPLSELEGQLDQLNEDEEYYTICHDGKGAKKAAELLDKNGFEATRVEQGVPEYPGELDTVQ